MTTLSPIESASIAESFFIERKPIYLFADSQPFFSSSMQDHWNSFSKMIKSQASAAYVGANSNDNPDFFELCKEAVKNLGIPNIYHVRASGGEEDLNRLDKADVIIIGGGNVTQGWNKMNECGIRQVISKKYVEGAFLMGVSAGAVQLGWSFTEGDHTQETYRLVPLIISAHDEKQNWNDLLLQISSSEMKHGIGITSGGVVVYHPDSTLEVLLKTVEEFEIIESEIKHTLLAPLPITVS